METLILIGFLAVVAWGNYALWRRDQQRENLISTALETPEGREALARALIEVAKKE